MLTKRQKKGIAARQAVLDFLHKHGKAATTRELTEALGGTIEQMGGLCYYMKLGKELSSVVTNVGSTHSQWLTPLVTVTGVAHSRININTNIAASTNKRCKPRNTDKPKSTRPHHYVHLGTQGDHPIPDQGGQGGVTTPRFGTCLEMGG